MPTIAQLHTEISASIRRSTTLDSYIPAALKRAARQIERNYSCKYMERYATFTISDGTVTRARSIVTPDTNFKRIHFMKVQGDDGQRYDVIQIDPKELHQIEDDGRPGRFWIDGLDYFWFDRVPADNYSAELSYDRFTTWPTDYSQTPWLCANADDLLICKSLQNLRVIGRFTQTMIAELEDQEKKWTSELIRSDEELRGSVRDERMNYGVIED